MASVDSRPLWRVTLRSPAWSEPIVRDVFDQYPGGAIATALGGLLTLTENYRDLAPGLVSLEAETERL